MLETHVIIQYMCAATLDGSVAAVFFLMVSLILRFPVVPQKVIWGSSITVEGGAPKR